MGLEISGDEHQGIAARWASRTETLLEQTVEGMGPVYHSHSHAYIYVERKPNKSSKKMELGRQRQKAFSLYCLSHSRDRQSRSDGEGRVTNGNGALYFRFKEELPTTFPTILFNVSL